MKFSAVPSLQNRIEKFALSGLAALGARQILGVLALIVVLWVGGCASSTTTGGGTSNTAPAITTSPANVTVAAGATATFTAAATGTPAPTVQWQVSTNGGTSFTAVAGATSTTLSFTTTASQNGSLYEAVFTNSVSSATTTAATLTVTSAPVITTNPSNVTVTAGANAVFTAAATGSPTPTVQWQVSTNGGTSFTNLSGATSATLTITAATAAMNLNQYKAVFTNSTSSATTTTATLTVNVAPVITTNPTAGSVAAGSTATFTAAATGQPTPTVQWMVSTNGGTSFSMVPGATSPTLSFTTIAGMNGNVYEAVFTNAAGTATTTTATLTVTSAPTITTNPAPLTIGSGATATFTAAATGNPTPTVQWFVSTTGGGPGSFNAIVGATSPTLSFTASLALSGNVYEAVFTNSVSATTTTTALLTVTASLTVSVSITNPSTSPITVGTGALLNFSAAIVNGAAGTGVNWSVNGVAGGNSTVGTITTSTLGGALATYTAPATAPGAAVAIVATYAGAGAAASAPANVNVVANHNATLSGQFVFQTRGFQVSGLPVGMVGTFTANGTGGLTAVLIDTNTVTSAGGGSTFTSKVAWNGSYSMDSASHGLIHLTLASAPTTQMNFGFTFSSGSGTMVELDTPLGSTATGGFTAASSSSFTLGAGGLNGTYVMQLSGPDSGGGGNTAFLGQMTFAPTGSSTTAGTIAGTISLQDGSTTTIVGGTATMDTDGSGHASLVLPVSLGGQLLLSVYVSTSGRIFTLESDSGSAIRTGLLRSQTIPVGGFTAANVFTSAMLFEAIGVDPTNNHASVIVGGFSPGAGSSITGEFDANDGGTVPGSSPVALTGTFTADPTVPGLGTLTFTGGPTFIFYMRSQGQGFVLETLGVNSASRVGQLAPQTEPGGGFLLSTLNGITQNVGTATVTPASGNGVAIITFGSGTYTASADGSALAQPPFITGSSTGTVAITDAVRGRGTVTPVTGSIFGSAHAVFYTIDNSGAFIMISVDPTTLEPQIIIVGN